MLYTFENRVPLMRQVALVVWHHPLPLINRFNKTEAAFSHAGYPSWGLFLFSVKKNNKQINSQSLYTVLYIMFYPLANLVA